MRKSVGLISQSVKSVNHILVQNFERECSHPNSVLKMTSIYLECKLVSSSATTIQIPKMISLQFRKTLKVIHYRV